MNDNKYTSYNSLMKHMRSKGIDISGSAQKRKLYLMGYYHGIKGYRFHNTAQNKIQYSDFGQIQDVVEFDETLKSILYLPLMQLESAIKSIACDKIIQEVGSCYFSDVFEKGIPKSEHSRFRTRDSIYSALTKRYDSSKIIQHYYHNDNVIPLWSIFEELMLGDLSQLIQTLNPSIKLAISNEMGIPQALNTDGALLPKIILCIKDLRNSIAHNKVVFDGRYIEFKKRGSMKEMLNHSTGIPNVNCTKLSDDVILVILIMKNLKFNKPQIRKIVTQIIAAITTLKSKLSNELFQEIVTDFPEKMRSLLSFIDSKSLGNGMNANI